MKITEAKLKSSTLFSKEIRHIDITEVTAPDREELYQVLLNLGFNEHPYDYQVYVNKALCSFKTQEEAWHFKSGFQLAMELGGVSLSSYPDRPNF